MGIRHPCLKIPNQFCVKQSSKRESGLFPITNDCCCHLNWDREAHSLCSSSQHSQEKCPSQLLSIACQQCCMHGCVLLNILQTSRASQKSAETTLWNHLSLCYGTNSILHFSFKMTLCGKMSPNKTKWHTEVASKLIIT